MTSITEKKPHGVSNGAGDVLRDSLSANLKAAGDMGVLSRPSVVRHEQFRTFDPEDARRFFAAAYTPGWRITGIGRGSAVKHRRYTVPAVTLDDVLMQGRVNCEIPGADDVLVIQPRAGALTVSANRLPELDHPVLVAHDMPCVLWVNSGRFDVVSIGSDVLRKAAAGQYAPLPQKIRFLDWRPCSSAAARAWHRALEYAKATLYSADTAGQPLIAATVATVLATALLECYPSNLTADSDVLSDPAVPEALKDAVSFIHCHAGADVGIHEVAAAVHLTPRAVQYLFRHQLDTTPTRYLRRVRLHRAHLDLLSSDRSLTTVAEVAQRWGFLHTGRFAVQYRKTYGQSPHTTLRQ
ncbi:helix-turn-helix transcriptional regulator [Mycobacterium sherrisii]|uniref:helix-turn-helix transcriptional regulator n=1 Tax=Mycobacterium sherrisii TaxID=243061 RepID=UPI003974DCFD